MDQDLLKPEEVAGILKISKYTVYEMVKRGDLQAIRIGRKMRFDPEEIERFKNGNEKLQQDHPIKKEIETSSLPASEFQGRMIGQPILFLGSHDLAIEELVNEIRSSNASLNFFTGFIGSMDGLLNLYFGKCDIAGCHLFDEETGQYNLPFIRRVFPGEKMYVVHFVNRNLGWIVPKGNPKQLTGWQDIARADLKIINRQKGAGTRILLDYYIRTLHLSKTEINGYNDSERTHIGAASRVARGLADAALGTESAAKTLGLDFIFLTQESYDFVMKPVFFESPQGQAFISILQRPSLKTKIIGLGGYDTKNIGSILGEDY